MFTKQLDTVLKGSRLVDWDHAKDTSTSGSVRFTQSVRLKFLILRFYPAETACLKGTWHFISLYMLQKPAEPMLPQDDLESTFWLLLYLGLFYMDCKRIDDQDLEQWYTNVFDSYKVDQPLKHRSRLYYGSGYPSVVVPCIL